MAIVSRTLEAPEVRKVTSPVIALGVAIAILYWGRVFFITSITAVIIAFLLEPFVVLLVRVRVPRAIASLVVCIMALFCLYLAGLGTYTQLSRFFDNLPRYSRRIGEIVDIAQVKLESMEQKIYQIIVPAKQRERERERQAQLQQQIEQSRQRRRKSAELPVPATPAAIPEVRIHDDRQPIADYIYARLGSFYQIFLMASFVPFLVYFMLSWRDHVYRSFVQFFEGEDRMIAARSVQGIAEMVRAFVVGNFVLGCILAAASSLAFWVIGLPYPLLVGPLSGFLSLVPYVGLPLALVPPIFVALAGYNTLSGYLLVAAIVATLHLSALNVLYPKIVGARVHLNPLVVTFAIMLWGFLWDAAGLVLAIPLTAGIKAVCDNVKGLRPYGKFLGD